MAHAKLKKSFSGKKFHGIEGIDADVCILLPHVNAYGLEQLRIPQFPWMKYGILLGALRKIVHRPITA
ncbi:MAG: hypothetical protein LBU32_04840, partial [Clostridiales bacterium]|nr:hypothetical protein [Clostridiales bacterium]